MLCRAKAPKGASWDENSSDRFRSYVLSVMSRARFHCATLLESPPGTDD